MVMGDVGRRSLARRRLAGDGDTRVLGAGRARLYLVTTFLVCLSRPRENLTAPLVAGLSRTYAWRGAAAAALTATAFLHYLAFIAVCH